MRRYFADFHIHIGSSHGRPVKISAAKNMTLARVLDHATADKGLDIITVIDGVCPPVQEDFVELLQQGALRPVEQGGYLYQDKLLVILGAEIEIAGPSGGAAHFGCWLPTIEQARAFSQWLLTVQKNPSLSSQRARTTADELQKQVASRNGLFIVHHAFTPHKGLFGNCVSRMGEMLDQGLVDAVELGLSADTDMADSISELETFSFLSNSDAHSLPKIAREYNELTLKALSFTEVRKALRRQDGRSVVANYGLEPKLGKYHRTSCTRCGTRAQETGRVCQCGSTAFTRGVYDRWLEIRDLQEPHHPSHRGPYHHQIPLEFVPGLGPKTRQRLIQHFGSEMAVLHTATEPELAAVCGEKLAHLVEQARSGQLKIQVGGGGHYGKIVVQ